MNKAIFLDRDGTLNKAILKDNDINFKLRPPYNLEEFHIFEDLHFLKSFLNKYYFLVITNQPDIKRGYQTEEFNNFINSSILEEIDIKKIYTCFCHESDPGCNCYKPSPGLILNAIKEFNIDIEQSYFIGDTWRDIELCKNININSILIDRGFYSKMKKNFLVRNLKPDHVISSFSELQNIIK